MVLDEDGLPKLPEGMYWKFKVTLLGSGSVQIRQRGWLFSKKVCEQQLYYLPRVGMNEAAEACYQKWQQDLRELEDFLNGCREDSGGDGRY